MNVRHRDSTVMENRMYPFNRSHSLTVDEEHPLSESNGCQQSPSKTIVNNIIEMNNKDDEWVAEMNNSNSADLSQCTWRIYNMQSSMRQSFRGVTCVSRCLRHVLMLLRILALFPGIRHKRRGQKKDLKRVLQYILLVNLSLGMIIFNVYLLHKNLWLIDAYKLRFGLMHASTVSCIITGIKPMINAFVIALFLLKIKDHLRLLRTVDQVDVCFRSAFHLSPPITIYKSVFFLLVVIAFLIPFTFRVVEFTVTEQRLGTGLIQDTAFIIVPVLTLWNMIPLMYYDMFNRIVRFYCRVLIKSLNKEHKRRHFSLKFYYEQFLRITSESIGNLFNPFLLFSLAWSMLVLCLTIYFMTQPHSSLLEPITEEQITNPHIRHLLTRNVHFTMCWAGLQMLVALLHIVIICSTGMFTNETTRQVVNAVLRIVPDANADLDRFQISCFVHKMSTQFMWGMTVWRAFPLERTTFFTLVSVVVTYSFLLLKLKENPAVMPITRSFIMFQNASSSTSAP